MLTKSRQIILKVTGRPVTKMDLDESFAASLIVAVVSGGTLKTPYLRLSQKGGVLRKE